MKRASGLPAGAALALQQDRRIRKRRLPGQLHSSGHGRVTRDQRAANTARIHFQSQVGTTQFLH